MKSRNKEKTVGGENTETIQGRPSEKKGSPERVHNGRVLSGKSYLSGFNLCLPNGGGGWERSVEVQ